MAHVRKKFALGMVGHFRDLFGQPHFLLRMDALSYFDSQVRSPLLHPLFQFLFGVLQGQVALFDALQHLVERTYEHSAFIAPRGDCPE